MEIKVGKMYSLDKGKDRLFVKVLRSYPNGAGWDMQLLQINDKKQGHEITMTKTQMSQYKIEPLITKDTPIELTYPLWSAYVDMALLTKDKAWFDELMAERPKMEVI